MTESDISLLNRGLSFIPTPSETTYENVMFNKNRLIRNIKLKYHFRNVKNKFNPNKKTFRNKSTWTPSFSSLSSNVRKTIGTIHKQTLKCTLNNRITRNNITKIKLNRKPNLSPQELNSIDKLKNNQEIIIKSADKGGATVIMDKENYVFEINRQLNDNKYYKKINEPIYLDNAVVISQILNKLKAEKFIDQDQFEYLSGPINPRPRTFYILPKIHKPLSKWTISGKMPEGRPIVSDINSESYRASQYLESFLAPLANKHASYLKNSYDFVNKIRNAVVPGECLIVTADVSALYTNMHHDRIVSSIRQAFQNFPDPTRPDNILLELLDFILKHNDFEFNNQNYLQICGCPMGKIIGPSAANIYLIDFDFQAMHNFKIKPYYYFRFLDDIFFIWIGTVTELMQYEKFLNNLIPDINLKFEYSTISANFLDITIFKEKINNCTTLQTKVYFKETDTHQLLHRDSFHPRHIFKSILKSQLIRFKRLSSNFKDYIFTCKTLFHCLHDRGYSWSLMWGEMKNIWFHYADRAGLTTNTDILPIIVPFDSIGQKLASDYRLAILNNPDLKHIKPIVAYENHDNLRKLLIRSKFNNNPTSKILYFNKHCKNKKCTACNYIVNNSEFCSTITNKIYQIKSNLNCKSTNIIYLITCDHCKLQYVGQTSRTLADRINNHLSCIRTKKNTTISLHFNLPDHNYKHHFKIIAIETTNKPQDLRQRERYWQDTLKTLYPLGINNFNLDHF